MLGLGQMDKISEQGLLGVLADFDEHGGSSIGLVAWELFTTERQVRYLWDRAVAEGWLAPAGRDETDDEQLWRLTPSGWAAHRRAWMFKPARRRRE
jgi:hypothetical protein